MEIFGWRNEGQFLEEIEGLIFKMSIIYQMKLRVKMTVE